MEQNVIEHADNGQHVTLVIGDNGDYTLSRRQMFDDMTLEEVLENTSEYMKAHPLAAETKARLERFRNEES